MDKQTREPAPEQPSLNLTLILSEQQCQKLPRIAKEQDIRGGIVVLGKGTVESATLNLLGIKSQKKEVVHFLLEREKGKKALDIFAREFQFHQPGHGIAYTTPVITPGQIMGGRQGAWDAAQGTEEGHMFQKLTVVVNRGAAEDVMEIARKSGAKGGTILHGRGTGAEFTQKLFGMEVEPEKELVIILMPSALVEKVVTNLFRSLELDVPGNGILFVEPILDARGLFESHHSGKEA